ncbi:MAG TPA: lysylphosphatidylglycerol synthase transmembrane domain-containing protein, partial [Pseudomonadales bacterium]|nr:lysylphosphatidylglycerol synthase transmembrane domain-containing protein [Pseudomonadales bacterium]
AASCGLSLVNYFLRFLRWHLMIAKMDHQLPFWRHCLFYISGFALTTTPGKAGEAIRGVYMKQHDVAYSKTIAALFAERVSDLISMLLLGCLAFVHFGQYRIYGFIFAAVVIVTVILVQLPHIRDALRKRAHKLESEKMRTILENAIKVFDEAARLLGFKFFTGGVILGVVAWGSEALALALVVHWMGSDAPATVIYGIYALAMLVGAASFLPGGLGGAEASMALLLVAMGMSHPAATSATVICRATTLWFAVLIGAVALLFLELRNTRAIKQV